jgi:hypothetical protein
MTSEISDGTVRTLLEQGSTGVAVTQDTEVLPRLARPST